MTSLFNISGQYQSALAVLTDSDLPDEAINDTLEGLKGELVDKGKNVAAFVRNIESDADAIDDAVKMMQARSRVIRNKAKHIRTYLHTNMEAAGISEISCPYFQLKVKKNPPRVVVTDERLVPNQYKSEVVTVKIDKAQIKRDGGCDGAVLEQGTRLEIK